MSALLGSKLCVPYPSHMHSSLHASCNLGCSRRLSVARLNLSRKVPPVVTTNQATHNDTVTIACKQSARYPPPKATIAPYDSVAEWADTGASTTTTSRAAFQTFGINATRTPCPPPVGGYHGPPFCSKDAQGASLPRSTSTDAFQEFVNGFELAHPYPTFFPPKKPVPYDDTGLEAGLKQLAKYGGTRRAPPRTRPVNPAGTPWEFNSATDSPWETMNQKMLTTYKESAWRTPVPPVKNRPPFCSKDAQGKPLPRSTSTDSFQDLWMGRPIPRMKDFRPHGT